MLSSQRPDSAKVANADERRSALREGRRSAERARVPATVVPTQVSQRSSRLNHSTRLSIHELKPVEDREHDRSGPPCPRSVRSQVWKSSRWHGERVPDERRSATGSSSAPAPGRRRTSARRFPRPGRACPATRADATTIGARCDRSRRRPRHRQSPLSPAIAWKHRDAVDDADDLVRSRRRRPASRSRRAPASRRGRSS